MELTFFGIGILGLLAWRHAWNRTSLDCARDRLFDLRDQNRQWFIENGYGLGHPMYKEMRDCINELLFYTKTARFSTFIYCTRTMPKEIKDNIQQDFQNRFDTSDENLRAYLETTRGKAIRALQRYMFETSFTVFLLVLITIPLAILSVLHSGMTHLLTNARNALLDRIDRCIIRPQAVEMIASHNPRAA